MYRKDSEGWLKHADLLVIFCYGTMKGVLKAILYLFLLQQRHIKNRKGENLSLLV